MRTSGHASKIENSPAHVGYMMCETVPQATPRQTQEVVVGWVVDWRVSMLMAYIGKHTSSLAKPDPSAQRGGLV